MNGNAKKSKGVRLTEEEVKHIAKLANLQITGEEEKKLTAGFNDTLEVVDKLFQLDGYGRTIHVLFDRSINIDPVTR